MLCEGNTTCPGPIEATYDITLAKIVKGFPASAPVSGKYCLFELFILLIFHRLECVSFLIKEKQQTMSKRALRFLLPLAGLLLGYTGLRLIVFFYTDWLWFQNLGYGSVLVTSALARLLAFFAFGSTFAVLAVVNVSIARKYGRHTREMPLEVIVADAEPVLPERRKRQLILWSGTIALLTCVAGLIGAAAWLPLLRYFYPVPFGFSDPVFDNDLSFYLFSLPAYNFVQGWLAFAVVLTIILVSFSYHRDRALCKAKRGWSSTPYVRAHLSVLSAILAFGLRLVVLAQGIRNSLFLSQRHLLRRRLYRTCTFRYSPIG